MPRGFQRIRAELEGQLPPRGPARVAVLAMLAAGGAIAAGLTVLVLVFLATALCGPAPR